jgi:hypothetical protein
MTCPKFLYDISNIHSRTTILAALHFGIDLEIDLGIILRTYKTMHNKWWIVVNLKWIVNFTWKVIQHWFYKVPKVMFIICSVHTSDTTESRLHWSRIYFYMSMELGGPPILMIRWVSNTWFVFATSDEHVDWIIVVRGQDWQKNKSKNKNQIFEKKITW